MNVDAEHWVALQGIHMVFMLPVILEQNMVWSRLSIQYVLQNDCQSSKVSV